MKKQTKIIQKRIITETILISVLFGFLINSIEHDLSYAIAIFLVSFGFCLAILGLMEYHFANLKNDSKSKHLNK